MEGGAPSQRVARLLGIIGTWPSCVRPPRGDDGSATEALRKRHEASPKNGKRRKKKKKMIMECGKKIMKQNKAPKKN